MSKPSSPGTRLRDAVVHERPLQIIGVINPFCALMAEQVGFKALYLSGAGVANYTFGLPDLGITNSTDVSEQIRRITAISALPLLVDADTGWGSAFNIARTVKEFQQAGAAGLHIEDQIQAKRCGHRPGKQVVSQQEMVDRVKAALDARTDSQFVIMARTDALAVEGLEAALERAQACVQAGADMIFAEALETLEHYQQFTQAIPVPVLANITEFGKTPLFSAQELAEAGVSLVLYPLSAVRAMNAAALQVMRSIRETGSQKAVIDMMQTREQLYELLQYYEYEAQLDRLFAQH
ncbi:MAG: methylisocitrate lyase [Gammaproteobacteria bacterium]